MTNCYVKNHVAAGSVWLVYLLLSLWLALIVAWKASAALGYGYPFWYERLAIGDHISQYAPQHPYKPGFSQLPAEQHHQAFAQIAAAVHRGGAGLEQIAYAGPAGVDVTLLDKDEVGHLQDVAALMKGLERATLVALPAWLLAGLLVISQGVPSVAARMVSLMALGLSVALPVLVWGPKAVFYSLHEWIFPPGHPWFFYWNESLMSTLMKAPYLFGGIASRIGVMALPLWWLIYRSGITLAGRIRARGLRGRN